MCFCADPDYTFSTNQKNRHCCKCNADEILITYEKWERYAPDMSYAVREETFIKKKV